MAEVDESLRMRLGGGLRRRLTAAPRVLLFAQAVHVVGDAMVAAALASTLFFDVPVGEARTDVAHYLALAFAPYALLMPLVAPLISRKAEAHGAVVVVADVGRALLAVLLISELTSAWLYPLSFLILVLSRTHGVSRAALVPRLVPEDGLLDANAAISLVSGAAGLVGGVVGLLLAAAGGPSLALLMAAAVLGAGSLAGLWLSPPRVAPHEEARDGEDAVESGTRSVLAGTTASRAALGFTGMLLAFTFHGGGARVSLVVSLGALGIGAWSASVAIGLVRRAVAPPHIPAAATASLIPLAALPLVLDGAVLAALVGAGVGFLAATARLGFDAHIQEQLAPRMRGRGYARYETLLQLAWVAGAAPAALFGLSLSAGAIVVGAIGVVGVIAVTGVGTSSRLARRVR